MAYGRPLTPEERMMQQILARQNNPFGAPQAQSMEQAVAADLNQVRPDAIPGATPGMNISQMPLPGCSRMTWRRPSQSLNSPITLTRDAFGAQTAKRTPSTPS